MPLTYPMLMPEVGALAIDFGMPERVDYTSPENSGRIGGVQSGWPHFTLSLDLNNLPEPDARVWRSFVRSLRGAQRRFLAWDPWRRYPIAHSGGFSRMTYADGSAFSGAAGGWSQSITGNGDALLTLTGVPKGIRLTADDYIGLKWDADGSEPGTYDRRLMAVAQEDGVADADGSITVTVEPPLPDWTPAGAVAHLDQPCCLMKQRTGETKIGRRMLPDHIEAGSKFVAVQELLP